LAKKKNNDKTVNQEIKQNMKIASFVKKETLIMSILFFIGVFIMKIVFYNENIFVILRTMLSFFWLFVLPGFALMYYWHEKINFVERFLLGVALSLAIIGIISYYLGLVGFNIKYDILLLPLVCFAVSAFVLMRKFTKI